MLHPVLSSRPDALAWAAFLLSLIALAVCLMRQPKLDSQ